MYAARTAASPSPSRLPRLYCRCIHPGIPRPLLANFVPNTLHRLRVWIGTSRLASGSRALPSLISGTLANADYRTRDALPDLCADSYGIPLTLACGRAQGEPAQVLLPETAQVLTSFVSWVGSSDSPTLLATHAHSIRHAHCSTLHMHEQTTTSLQCSGQGSPGRR